MLNILGVIFGAWLIEWLRRGAVARLTENAWLPRAWMDHLPILLLQDAWVAWGLACLAALLGWVPGGSSVLLGLLAVAAATDGLLFAACGLRLQPGLLQQRQELSLLSRHAWVFGLIVLMAGVLAAGAAAALPTAHVAPAVIALGAGGCFVAFLSGRRMAARLPASMHHAWSHGLFLLHRRGPVEAETDLLAALREHESCKPIDSAYPLLRTTTQFKGERLVDFAIPPGSKPHVIFVLMESFRAADVGALGGTHNATPCFDALAREGALWKRFYTHSNASSRAIIASLYGVLPGSEIFPTRATSHGAPLIGLPHIFTSQGYLSHYFTNGPMQFEDNGQYLLERGFAEAHGRVEIARRFPQAGGTLWGPFDEYLMDYHLEWLKHQDARATPTFSTLFTMTHHDPYVAPQDAPFPQSPGGLPGGVYSDFLRTMHYADACLGKYVAALKKAGLDKRVVLCVLGDTGQQLDARFRLVRLGGTLRDEAYRIPLMLWAPSYLRGPTQIDRLGGQIDLLPTVLDLFQLSHPHHSLGTSLVRDTPERPVHMIHPYAPVRDSMRVGNWRFNRMRHSDACSLFDTVRDPAEEEDLSAQAPHVLQTCRTQSGATQDTVAALHRTHRFVSKEFVAALAQQNVHLPQSLHEAHLRLVRLQACAGTPEANATLERIFRAYLAAPLPDAERLEYLQLRLKRHYGAINGEEKQRLEALRDCAEEGALRQVAGALVRQA